MRYNNSILWNILLVCMMSSCDQPGKQDRILPVAQDSNPKPAGKINDTVVSNELGFLNEFNGKYPLEIKLFENKLLQRRLKKMMGSQFDYIKSIWQVETPIEISDGLFYAWGMQAHSGGDPSAVLMADLSRNVLFAGIRKDEKSEVFSEDGSSAPKKLLEWAKEH